MNYTSLDFVVLAQLKRDGHWFDIGQISKDTQKVLNRLLKKGFIRKEQALWPWVDIGTITKTIYYPTKKGLL